jgi:hypothetical protein
MFKDMAGERMPKFQYSKVRTKNIRNIFLYGYRFAKNQKNLTNNHVLRLKWLTRIEVCELLQRKRKMQIQRYQ